MGEIEVFIYHECMMITIMKKEHWKSALGCVYNINYHIVYSTKYRKKVLTGEIGEALKKIKDR